MQDWQSSYVFYISCHKMGKARSSKMVIMHYSSWCNALLHERNDTYIISLTDTLPLKLTNNCDAKNKYTLLSNLHVLTVVIKLQHYVMLFLCDSPGGKKLLSSINTKDVKHCCLQPCCEVGRKIRRWHQDPFETLQNSTSY